MKELDIVKSVENLLKGYTYFINSFEGYGLWENGEEQYIAKGKEALAALNTYLETPKEEDRYHYGYAACKKEFADMLDSSELVELVLLILIFWKLVLVEQHQQQLIQQLKQVHVQDFKTDHLT